MKKTFFLFALLIFSFCSLFSCRQNSSIDSGKKQNAFPQSQFDSAYELLIQSDYENATKAFSDLTKSFSQFPEIWYNYATCLMETKSYAKAKTAFKKAIKTRKNVVMYENPQIIKEDAMTSILEVLLLESDFKSAEKLAKKCLKENNSQKMEIAILATYLRLGFSNKAEDFFTKNGIDVKDFVNVQK